MNPILLIAYVFLFIAALIVSYQLLPILLKKAQQIQRKAKQQESLKNISSSAANKKAAFIFKILPFALAIAAYVFFSNLLIALGAAAVGFVLPYIYKKQLVKARKAKFGKQLVDGLMIISNSLKAGLSILQAMECLVDEMPSPIQDEFSLIIREIRMGVSLEEAITNLSNRVSSEEMDLISSAILVAKETGGDLTKVFTKLIATIRERNKLKEMVTTLTMQGKLQGIIMSLIPIVFVVFVLKSNPQHFDIMLKDEMGKMLLVAAGVMQLAAFFMIKKFSVVKI